MRIDATLTELLEAGFTCRVVESGGLHCWPSKRLTPSLRGAVRENKRELVGRIALWQALAETEALPEKAETWPEEVFLTACVIFRDASTQEGLAARWDGLRTWLAGELPIEAMLVLQGMVHTLLKGGLP